MVHVEEDVEEHLIRHPFKGSYSDISEGSIYHVASRDSEVSTKSIMIQRVVWELAFITAIILSIRTYQLFT